MREEAEMSKLDNENDFIDWIFIAKVIDKLCFMIFLTLLVTTALSLLFFVTKRSHIIRVFKVIIQGFILLFLCFI